ncbi:MAG: hypothetical protein CL850_03275 [Crocinitomicaceae bacterium]|nr:hypothetical protein [Crocinitomicaceae bacterium]|tara:strand:+ start:111 stop:1871 length:1761 start_codon:yes stop_codon:yes gene_type:complete
MEHTGNIFSSDTSVIAQLKRNQLINIDNSYNNEWDLLAELAQNCIDAIKLTNRNDDNLIDIIFDVDNRSISVIDNGCGFCLDKSPNSLLGNPTLLDINVTTKTNDPNQIGEKGVGLKYVIFNSNNVILSTSDGNKSAELELSGFLNWKNSDSTEFPKYNCTEGDGKNPGTKIILKELDGRFDKLFQLSKEQLIFVLRTKTAIGRTNVYWDQDLPKIKVQLTYIKDGQRSLETDIPSHFMDVSENHPNVIDYDNDYQVWLNKSDRTDKQKIAKLKNKIITRTKKFTIPETQREIKLFLTYLPKREIFEHTTINQGLCSQEEHDSEIWQENFGFSTFHSGIEISSKGMPTGIKISEPTTGYSGYWKNIYMLFEDDSLVFDIGRKSIDGRTTRKIKEFAKTEFNFLLKTITRYISGTSTGFSQHFNKVKVFSEITDLYELGSDKSKFVKSPENQEASVAAIFYELIGNGTLTGIIPIISGYKETYDLYAYVENSTDDKLPAIIEFKSKLRNLLPDLAKQIKYTNDIDCIVCYNVTDDDISKFEDEGFTITILETPDDEFPCATHKVSLSNAKDYWVIDIKNYLFPTINI